MWEVSEGDSRVRRERTRRQASKVVRTVRRKPQARKHANPLLRVLAIFGLWPDPLFF